MSKEYRKSKGWVLPVSLILILLIILIVIIILLNGHTTITSTFVDHKKTETLVCEGNKVNYSNFAYSDTDDKLLKINAAFENDKLETISLIYKLKYQDEDTRYFSEARNHAEINESFYSDGMKTDDLNAKYSVSGNNLQFSIYAKGEDINVKSLKYFMLYNIYEVKNLTKEKMAKIYNEAGLDCKIKHNKTKEEVNEN